MGSIVGKAMDDNMKKQQDFMLKTQQLAMERQLAMQNEMRERQMAMMIGKSRDLFNYWITFYAISTVGLTMAGLKLKKPAAFAPLVPLTIATVYQYDLAYHTKLERIRETADRVLDEEHHLLALPHGMPSFDAVETARLKQKGEERFKTGHDIFL